MNVKIEIDFDPELDELFNITTSKQQIVIDDWLWEKLRANGKNSGNIEKLIADMRRRRKELDQQLVAKVQNNEHIDAPRPSSVAMDETDKFKGTPKEPTVEQQQDGERNLEREATHAWPKRAGARRTSSRTS